jgi:16S rRNA processing protein RimM
LVGETILLAEVDRPRGLRGEVLVTLHTDDHARLDEIVDVEIVERSGRSRSSRLEGWKHRGDRAVLKLAGIETVEEARAIAGAEIRIPREKSRQVAPEGRYFAWQLEGLQVVTLTGEVLGRVSRVLCPAGQTLLEVSGARGEFLVPGVPEICTEVDVQGGKIVVELPEGLVDLNAV